MSSSWSVTGRNDLVALRGRSWDAVIDASGRKWEWTRDAAEVLRDSVGTYLYVSSTGVYYPYLTTEITEDTRPVLVDPSEGVNIEYRYGVMKALSEVEARRVFGERTCVVRPGFIVGPLDRTNRGTYWPERLRRGGDVLVPGKRGDLVQQIDVRDLTEWWVPLLEDGVHGVFNATGPSSPMTMEEFVFGVRATSSAEVRWTWVDDYQFLREQGIMAAVPWIMPVGNDLGSQRIDCGRAKGVGLTFRSVAETAMETLEWYHSDGVTDEQQGNPPMVVSAEREAEVLEAWGRFAITG